MKRAFIIAGLIVALLAVVASLTGCAQGPSAAQQKEQCFANERVIETMMKVFKADSGVDAPIKDVLDATHVVCPSGGTYSYDPTTGVASCSIHGHP
jgi:hypothetical protein